MIKLGCLILLFWLLSFAMVVRPTPNPRAAFDRLVRFVMFAAGVICICYGVLTRPAQAHSIVYVCIEELHNGSGASASYATTREQYGYPPYATERLVWQM